MSDQTGLPPGQRAIDHFPRFGLNPYAERFPKEPDRIALTISGDGEALLTGRDLAELPRVEQTSDFHCVTTWSKRSLTWSGVRLADVYDRFLAPLAEPRLLIFRCQDGYRVGLLLEDALAPDVILADRLDGAPLSIAHGAPLRLVAPAHYGYKNPKHLKAIELSRNTDYRPAALRFMDHPRARVALEERGRWIPGPILRLLYRPLIAATARRFREALRRHQADSASAS